MAQEELEGGEQQGGGHWAGVCGRTRAGWHQQDGLEGYGGNEGEEPRGMEFSATLTVIGSKHQVPQGT